MVAWTLGMADFPDAIHQVHKAGEIGRAKNGFLGSGPKHDFGSGRKSFGIMGKPGAGKLQSVAAKGDLRSGQNGNTGLGHDGLNLRDGYGKTAAGTGVVGSVDQAGRDIAAVGGVQFSKAVIAFL